MALRGFRTSRDGLRPASSATPSASSPSGPARHPARRPPDPEISGGGERLGATGRGRYNGAEMVSGPVRLPGLVCAACLLGCGADAPPPGITGVYPARAYSDRELRVFIHGTGFVPRFRIDQASGQREGDVRRFSGRVGGPGGWRSLRDFDWLDENQMSAWLEAGLPAGVHTVEVTDPRGRRGAKEEAFWSLGADRDVPVVTFEKPAASTPIAAGMVLDVSVSAADPEPGSLHSLNLEAWAANGLVQSASCPFEPDPARARCDTQVRVPAWLKPGEAFALRARAADQATAVNRGEQLLSFVVLPGPTVTEIRPARGGIAGGTDLVIKGSGFLPGTRVSIGDLPIGPQGGTVLDAETIIGRAPPRPAGPATVLIRTPIGDAQLTNAFQYERPPQIQAVAPEVGIKDGGTDIRVRGSGFTPLTRIYFGDSLVAAKACEEQTFISDVEITGVAPAGTGTTSVWAFDAELGWTRLADGFSWSVQ